MVVVPLTQPERETAIDRRRSDSDAMNWARFAAGGTLLAGGVLMLTGNRKAGLVTAASGAALAILDQQETVKAWWDALPGYIDKVQHVLGQVEQTVAEVAAQRERIHQILSR
jgi:urease accessory protein UreE